MPYSYYYMDYWYLVLVLPAILLATIAQIRIKTSFQKYSGLNNARGYTGASAARAILDKNGLYHVSVERVSGSLSDHYDPRSNVIRLSDSVYSSVSVAAVGVAAHEAGHAIQHAENYSPIKMRNSVLPVANLGSSLAPFLIIAGFAFSFEALIWVGILLFSAVAVFQLITLPVEFNASKRALQTLENTGILYGDEVKGAKNVLTAAAMTYLAGMLVTFAHLLRFILLAMRNRRRD